MPLVWTIYYKTIQADGTKLSDLNIPGWANLKELIENECAPIIQYGIANGVHEHIRIGMTVEPGVVLNHNTAKDQRSTRLELMDIVSNSYAIHDRECRAGQGTAQYFPSRTS